MIVGNVVKSVGFGIYKEIRRIKTAIAIEMVSIRSRIPLGSGTIMIAMIATTKKTTLKSRWPSKKLRDLLICFLKGTCFAKCYSSIRSIMVTVSKKLSIFP